MLISCGEPSGDLYAGALAAEIFRLEPDAAISGFGGERLRASGATLVRDFRGLSVTGLTEALGVIPRSWSVYRAIVQAADAAPPDVFVPIDFPDFNFCLARALHRRGVPIVYYISPQLWAWRRGRIRTMKRIADRVLVIFPFEEAFYREAGVAATFVGHPLLELSAPAESRGAFLRAHGLDPAKPVVAILPGSRRNELRTILPDLVETAGLVATRLPDAQFVIARAPHLDEELFVPLSNWPPRARRPVVVENAADAVLGAADVALLASGTVTIQAALHGCPM
ncbi:MAG TPA: lipid-A-disaccharide synthase, partial [Vicinamibacterales bacterium]